jgi:RND family efflux transporter MFP subunit
MRHLFFALLLAPMGLPAAHAAGPVEGVVLPFHEVDVSAQATGPITELNVKEGDPVKAGQPLAQIYARLQELEVERAKAQLERHEFDAKGAKKLFESKIIPESRALEMRIEFELARLQFETANEQLKLRTVTAPLDGIVVERYKDLGETVSTTQRVFRIVDVTKVYVRCLVRPERAAKLASGQKVTVRFPQIDPAAGFSAEVVLVDPCADASGLFRVKLLLDNPGGRIHSGFRALVDLGEHNGQG